MTALSEGRSPSQGLKVEEREASFSFLLCGKRGAPPRNLRNGLKGPALCDVGRRSRGAAAARGGLAFGFLS